MKSYEKNPRKISQKQFDDLKYTLEELGDLAGIIHDVNSDQIIGGNMRSEVFNINDCEIELVKEYDEPTRTGTLAEGFVIWNGERYAFRKVDWTEEQCEMACIVANKGGGEFDFEILANEWDVDDLKTFGFSELEIPSIKEKPPKKEKPGNDDEPKGVQIRLPKTPHSKEGQIYNLGQHQLFCGNAYESDEMEAFLFDGAESTDYLTIIHPDQSDKADAFTMIKEQILEANNLEDFVLFDVDYLLEKITPESYSWAVWSKFKESKPGREVDEMQLILTTLQHQSKVFHIEPDSDERRFHEQQIPVKLMMELIELSKKAQCIFDPFSGSGSVLMAAARKGKACRSVEINPALCDAIRIRYTRWANEQGYSNIGDGELS